MSNNQIKIAMFLPNLTGGGAERVAVHLANGLADRGYAMEFVLGQAVGVNLAGVSPKVRIVDLRAAHITTVMLPLIRYLRRERPDVLFSHLDHVNVGALFARCLARVPTRVVPVLHTTNSVALANDRSLRVLILRMAMRWLYPWASKIVAVSRGAADDMIDMTGVREDMVRVIYNPVIMPHIRQMAEERPSHPWLAPGGPPLILAVGRLTEPKSFATLLRAMAILRKKRDCRLLILGEGEDRPQLERLIRELQLAEIVSLPGFVDNPYGYLANCSLFVLSSAWEALPTVLIEALALGAPVVSTNCRSGPAEILHDGKYGRLVPVGDSKALAEAMETTLVQGRSPVPSEILQPYMADYAVEQYCQLIDEVLHG
jgi:glycosyltransferase involved in cell wall biosynthesis